MKRTEDEWLAAEAASRAYAISLFPLLRKGNDMPAPLRCPRHHESMKSLGDGQYVCPQGCTWLEDTPGTVIDETPAETWRPDGVSLSFVPGQVKGGGGKRGGPSPARQKQDAYIRRQMPGSHIRQVRLQPVVKGKD